MACLSALASWPLAAWVAEALADVLLDCVESGASVGFMHPLSRTKAIAFWQNALDSAARGERIVLVAEDVATKTIVGTVQIVLAMNTFSGTGLILLGVIVMLIAVRNHQQTVDQLERGELTFPRMWSLGVVLSLVLCALGMGIAIYLALL